MGNNLDDAGVVALVRLGEGHRRGGPAGVAGVGEGDLYREVISLVPERLVVVIALFFSAGTKGCLVLVLCFLNACSDSHTSIHSIPIRPH